MDELPIEARELLKLASDAHDPPGPEARARVRRGVAMAVGAGLGATIAGHAVAQGGVKAGVLSGLAGKLAAAGVAVAVASTVVLTLPANQAVEPAKSKVTTSQRTRVKHAAELRPAQGPEALERIADGPSAAPETKVPAQAAPEPLPAPAAMAVAPETVASTPRLHPRAKHAVRARASSEVSRARTPSVRSASSGQSVQKAAPEAQSTRASETPARDSLRAEMALLSQASQALSRGDLAAAEQALAQHRQTFHASLLGEERDGLFALLRCSEDAGAGRALAERFVARAPKSVLAKRVARACKLGGP